MAYILREALDMMENVTPTMGDCGLLCGQACCGTDGDGQGGVYLFPGEAAWLKGSAWATLSEGPDLGGCTVLTCIGQCERGIRPMGCRIFPLTPVRRKGGEWDVRLDIRAWAMCPLMEGRMRGLNPSFVETARRAVQLMGTDPVLDAFMRQWARHERSFHVTL